MESKFGTKVNKNTLIVCLLFVCICMTQHLYKNVRLVFNQRALRASNNAYLYKKAGVYFCEAFRCQSTLFKEVVNFSRIIIFSSTLDF